MQNLAKIGGRQLRRVVLLLVLLSIAAVPLAQAGDEPPPPPGTTEPAPSAEPPPSTLPSLVPDGVSISGMPVGGMTPEQAAIAVGDVFAQPLTFHHESMRWTVLPEFLGARAYLDGAISRALTAAPGSTVDLVVSVRGQDVRDYVASLDQSFSRAAKDSIVRLVKYRPSISKARDGFALSKTTMTAAIVRALRTGDRGPFELQGRVLAPRVTIANFGPVVVIRRDSKKLYVYDGQRFVRRFGVATGQSAYPTPIGRFEVKVKWKNPWWYPPPSPWAKEEKPVPPGPGNPLGTRWMGLTAPFVGIHGTPDSASIGYSASHGCIRMLIPDAEWVFDHVQIGTTVFIVRA